MDLRHLLTVKEEEEEVTGRDGRRSEDSRALSLREMHMPRMRAGRRWTSQLRAVLAVRMRVTKRARYAQRATVPPWMRQHTISGAIPRLTAERNAHASTKLRGYAAANLSLLLNIHQRRQHTMQSSFDYVSTLVSETNKSQDLTGSKHPLSDAPMLWGEYLMYREFHAPLAFCAFMASQLKHSRFTDSETGDKLGQLRPFREDLDPVATQAMWTHIALWDNHQLGFPCPVEWHFRETDLLDTYSKRFTMGDLGRIIDVAKKLNADATAVQADLEADQETGDCATFLLSPKHGAPAYLTLWEAKTWCRHAQHQATALRHACEVALAGRKSLYDEYIAEGRRMTKGEKLFDVCEYLGDYMLVSDNGDEVISL
jgi:hypothetical protein